MSNFDNSTIPNRYNTHLWSTENPRVKRAQFSKYVVSSRFQYINKWEAQITQIKLYTHINLFVKQSNGKRNISYIIDIPIFYSRNLEYNLWFIKRVIFTEQNLQTSKEISWSNII